MESITDERAELAIKFLCGTDESAAIAKSYMVGLEKQEKTILSIEKLASSQKTDGLREAEARSSVKYVEWCKAYENAVLDFETARNKRSSAALTVETWRSVNANRKRGNI